MPNASATRTRWEACTMEFHVSRRARDRYQFDDSLFSLTGNVVFANLHAARIFADKINQKRDLVSFPEQAVRASHINSMGLIDEILHMVVASYRTHVDPQVMAEAIAWLESRLGAAALDAVLLRFVDDFPPLAVYRRQVSVAAYLGGDTSGVPNREIALEELLMLWVTNANPAMSPFSELFDDGELEHSTAYVALVSSLTEFFRGIPAYGPANESLLDMLLSPARNSPHSLVGQLNYIRERWSAFTPGYLYRFLISLDLMKEEEKMVFAGPGPAQVLEFAALVQEAEPERYSLDLHWMPQLVMLAKSTYVWLDQLTRTYGRSITRLDEIPDEELDRLARWGFSGLWLIGLWERSRASQTIKRQMGNPEAVASAYSLHDYQIATDLGGEEAFQVLREKAWRRGIRLASDMVPNHMGMDSRWVIEHPDWFISLDHSPFPSYSFNGPDLSWDSRVGFSLKTTITHAAMRPLSSGALTAGPAARSTSTMATMARACPGMIQPSLTC